MSSHLFSSSLFSFNKSGLVFLFYFFPILLNLNLSIYSFGCYCKWNCFINSGFKLFNFELLVYKNIVDSLILVLYLTT